MPRLMTLSYHMTHVTAGHVNYLPESAAVNRNTLIRILPSSIFCRFTVSWATCSASLLKKSEANGLLDAILTS